MSLAGKILRVAVRWGDRWFYHPRGLCPSPPVSHHPRINLEAAEVDRSALLDERDTPAAD
jgi:hypothetical protein